MNETRLFRVALSVIALRVIDDTVLQPAAGTSVADHPISALIPLAVLAFAGWVYPRLRGTGRGGVALLFGVLGIVTGVDAWYYTRELGLGGDDVTGFAAIAAGLTAIGLGAVTLWRTRRTTGRLAWRYPRRALLAFAGFMTFAIVLFPTGYGYVTTHTARAVVPENRLGVAHENVSFETADGLTLRGWYIPSRNGAAVIVTPGRNGPQAQARMLAKHGYGVLLFDRRGEGESDGRPNAWGWGGDEDARAAIRFLERRPDVERGRIGGIGLSVGGEMMLEAAGEGARLAAVVSEGAGARTMGEGLDLEGIRAGERPFAALQLALRDATVAVFSDTAPPEHLESLVRRINAPTLLIAAPNTDNGEKLNRLYAKAGNAELWEIPESKHVQGIKARPAEYERRVVGFFDRAL
jgi:hypothetical protein